MSEGKQFIAEILKYKPRHPPVTPPTNMEVLDAVNKRRMYEKLSKTTDHAEIHSAGRPGRGVALPYNEALVEQLHWIEVGNLIKQMAKWPKVKSQA